MDQDFQHLDHLVGRIRGELGDLKKDVSEGQADAHAATSSLYLLRKLILMVVQDAVDNINALSTALDSFSLTEDKTTTDVTALIKAYQDALAASGGTLTPAQEAVVTKGQASLAALATMGTNADNLVKQVDAALPTPAPAGTPAAAKP